MSDLTPAVVFGHVLNTSPIRLDGRWLLNAEAVSKCQT